MPFDPALGKIASLTIVVNLTPSDVSGPSRVPNGSEKGSPLEMLREEGILGCPLGLLMRYDSQGSVEHANLARETQ